MHHSLQRNSNRPAAVENIQVKTIDQCLQKEMFKGGFNDIDSHVRVHPHREVIKLDG